jgi:PAS domain S-box-containing protein
LKYGDFKQTKNTVGVMDMQNKNEDRPDAELLIRHMEHGFAFCKLQHEGEVPSDFTYLMVNPAFERITGLKGVVGKKVTEVIPGIRESNPELFETYERVALTGKSEYFESHVPALNVWFSVTAYSPKKGYFVATFEDITFRKKAEIELRESFEFAKLAGLLRDQALSELEGINNNAPIGIAISSIDSLANRVILRANPYFEKTLFGYEQGELTGKSVRMLYASQNDFDENGRANVSKLMSTQDSTLYESNFVRKDGTPFLGRGKVTLLDPTNREKKVITLLQDVTEKRRAEEALNKSYKLLEEKELAKSRFLAAAGHDLRQPLTAANLFIDALKGTGTSNEQNEIIHRLDQAMSNFNVLLDTLLNVSKLDAGVVVPEFTSVSLAEIFSWLEQTFSQLCNEKHLRFKLYLPLNNSLIVRADIGLLKSVLMNLLDNAIKFTSKGGIMISARLRGEFVLFQVWDTGIGIQEKYVENIFDDFYQIENLHRDRSRGLGLGLSIAKRTLSLFEGKISCRSQFGRGSVFSFHLPIVNLPGKAINFSYSSKSMELDSIRQFVKGKRFVIVEDDALVSEAMSKSLTIMGGKVESYFDAEIALQQVNIENADCFIVDYMLPGNVDGSHFLLRINQKLHKPACAVMMSGNTDSYFIHKAEQYIWPMLHKPVNLEQLITRLSEQYNKSD